MRLATIHLRNKRPLYRDGEMMVIPIFKWVDLTFYEDGWKFDIFALTNAITTDFEDVVMTGMFGIRMKGGDLIIWLWPSWVPNDLTIPLSRISAWLRRLLGAADAGVDSR